MSPTRVILSSETKYELQEAITSIPGSAIDAYFALFEGGPDQVQYLASKQASKGPRAQSLLHLAEQTQGGTVKLADRFLSDRAKGRFGNASFVDLDKALADNGLAFETGRLVPRQDAHTSSPQNMSEEATVAAKQETPAPRPATSVKPWRTTQSGARVKESAVADSQSAMESPDPIRARTVFLVQGRYQQVNEALTHLLRALDLRVLTWEQAVELTGKPNPYIEEVIAAGMAAATAVLVLFTAEDRVQLEGALVEGSTPAELEAGHQPRPNVLIEAGMALAYDVAFRTKKLSSFNLATFARRLIWTVSTS